MGNAEAERAGSEEGREAPSELEAALAKVQENLDGWMRAQAELENYRKRVERAQADQKLRTTGRVVTRWLPVLDDLERALKDRDAAESLPQWAEGVELIYQKCLSVLLEEGVTPIGAKGQDFDPALHEALSYEACADHHEGEVIEVVRPGYRLGDLVLRPALVRVARCGQDGCK